MITREEIDARVARLREVLQTAVNMTYRAQYPYDYHTPKYRGAWHVYIELPHVEQLAYDQLLATAECLGTTEISFQSAVETGYYGDVDNIVRLWACWRDK